MSCIWGGFIRVVDGNEQLLYIRIKMRLYFDRVRDDKTGEW